MIGYIIYLFLSVLVSVVMGLSGYWITSLEWWVVVSAVIISFICGREYESKKGEKK